MKAGGCNHDSVPAQYIRVDCKLVFLGLTSDGPLRENVNSGPKAGQLTNERNCAFFERSHPGFQHMPTLTTDWLQPRFFSES